ncbi:MAG: GNAT family N-acetyltransferase [Armatimonadota bacterium]|nr:GNAT family N-acetyltransferase [bacterium]
MTDEIVVRRLAEVDLLTLAGLYKQFWGEESCLEKMRTTFARLKDDPDYVFLVAQQQGDVAGSVMGIACHELYGDCNPFMVIEDVIVDKVHRRKGVGTALMSAVERWGIDNGCKYVIFVTESDRVEAHRFYESLGYELDAHKGLKKDLINRLGHP